MYSNGNFLYFSSTDISCEKFYKVYLAREMNVCPRKTKQYMIVMISAITEIVKRMVYKQMHVREVGWF